MYVVVNLCVSAIFICGSSLLRYVCAIHFGCVVTWILSLNGDSVFVCVHQSSSGKLLRSYLCSVLTISSARTVSKSPATLVLTSMCKTVAFQTTKLYKDHYLYLRLKYLKFKSLYVWIMVEIAMFLRWKGIL